MLRPAALAVLAGVLLSACGGGGGGGGNQPPPASVTITGRITFDRIGFDATAGTGLNPTAPVESPARQVTVQAIDASSNAMLAATTTDTNGNYSVSVPSNRNLFIRARAEMIKTAPAPTWNFSVRNNTSAGTTDALYALDGNSASSGTANSTRNLRAPTGFGASSYTNERAAAPFAILDTVFKAKELLLTALPNAALPELRLFWSNENKPVNGCLDDGDIGTSSYVVFGPNDLDCGVAASTGIYLLGDADQLQMVDIDTDEFDESVIAHEFGHYVEDRFGRSDSIGGIHGGAGDLLDLRVAFGEGWGNAFSSMVRGDAVYRDSFNLMAQDFSFNVENDDDHDEGWFSEASVQEILWDLFDSTNESGDTASLGFAPLFAVMSGAQTTTDAMTSIFSFITGLKAASPSAVAAIDDLLAGEDIHGTGDFGTGETNFGGDPQLPPSVYLDITLNAAAPTGVCSRSPYGNTTSNKLGNRVFLRFNNDATHLVTIQLTGTPLGPNTIAAADPDVFVLRRGVLAAFGAGTGSSETTGQVSLPAGLYIIEVYDFNVDPAIAGGGGPQPRCMTVSVTGST